jgi:hypothetical protein
VLKIRKEAVVVEGMGSIVNMHADPRRGLSANAYVKEAFIHVNGPMTIDKADALVKEALDIHHFGDKPWHFTQRSALGSRPKCLERPKRGHYVISRLKAMVGALPFMEG